MRASPGVMQSGVPLSLTQNVTHSTSACGVGRPGENASGGDERVIAVGARDSGSRDT